MAKTPALTKLETFNSEQPNFSKVGDVVYSVLTEAQFQSERDSTWVLMDGRSVVGSAYATLTGNTTLPDARGQFLRGKNNGRNDGNEDPAGERAIGHQQADAMQGHHHVLYKSAVAGSFEVGTVGGGNGNPTTSTNQVQVPASDGVNGTPRTGPETRPKNLAVNIFIKIN